MAARVPTRNIAAAAPTDPRSRLSMGASLRENWSCLLVQSILGMEVHLPDLQLQIDRGAGDLAAQVAGELRTAVRSGRLAAGVRLPASRELARDLGTSRGV